jgi:hypothetical protein
VPPSSRRPGRECPDRCVGEPGSGSATILDADDRTALILASIRHHGAVLAAIAARDGARASRLARETLYAHYAEYAEPADRAIMADLVRECGGRGSRSEVSGSVRGGDRRGH